MKGGGGVRGRGGRRGGSGGLRFRLRLLPQHSKRESVTLITHLHRLAGAQLRNTGTWADAMQQLMRSALSLKSDNPT